MTAQLVTRLPPPPSRRNPVNFNTRADAFNDALLTFCDQINASTAGDSAAGLAQYLASGDPDKGSTLVTHKLNAVASISRLLSLKLEDWVTVNDFVDAKDAAITSAQRRAGLQAAIDHAAKMFDQTAFPPTGVFNPPLVVLPPGAHVINDTLNVPPGVTICAQAGNAYTVEHTRLILDTSGGTTNQNKHILKLTRFQGGVQRVNTGTYTIEDIGFWIVNPGATIAARGGTAWPVDAVTGLGTDGTGCCIYTEEPCIDVRIRRCSFYSTPNAAIWFNQANTTAQSDAEVSDCEFDTSLVAVRATNGALNLRMYRNQYYNNSFMLHASGSVGSVAIDGGITQLAARIKVAGGAVLDRFSLTGLRSEGAGALGTFLSLSKAKQVHIVDNEIGLCSAGTIDVTDADGGMIAGNTINDSGYNASVSNPLTDPGAIRLLGCANVLVAKNNILTRDAATYGGFGIVSLDNGGSRLAKNFFFNNVISASYNGAVFSGQSRRLNVATLDQLLGNAFGAGVQQDHRAIESTAGRMHFYSAQQQSTGTVDIPLAGASVARVLLHVGQVSSADNWVFEIVVKRANSTGVYTIASVTKDGTAGAGNGPHTILTGNTIAFSISSTNLRLTVSATTDPLVWSAQVAAAKY